MKNIVTITLFVVGFITTTIGQNLTQTVRGTILDTDSKLPLIGAQIRLVDSDPLVGAVTDVDGKFRLEKVAVGRISLQIQFLGYESITLSDIVVNSGKEVVLNIHMQEGLVKMDEFVVLAHQNKGELVNDMSISSGRSITLEETERFAGGFNDPSRILSNFAGVATSQNGNNEIIVRGNSPKYVQWRLEGVEITNPNHFADQNSVGGGISALNNNLLATSDFYTGAFSAEYGDVLSGVYDVKLRSGNNEKFESVFGLGLLGTDVTLEGPFKKGYGGSYLVNYRYSTLSLVSDMGLIDIGGVPKFQDATFKVVLPSKKLGVFSIFGLSGLSALSIDSVKANVWTLPETSSVDETTSQDVNKKSYLLNGGINHTISVGKNSFIKSSLTYSTTGIEDVITENKYAKIYDNQGAYLNDSIISSTDGYKSNLKNSTLRGAVTYNWKVNAKNKIQVGSRYSLSNYDNNQSWFQDSLTGWFTAIDVNQNISTLNNFVSIKHRLNENITIVAGLHNMNVLANNKSTLEPRLAMNWSCEKGSTLSLSYGMHSTMESVHHYFAKVEQPDGSIIEPNKDLGLLKSHHFVVGYEKRFSRNLRAKVELYYQYLYNLPVENNDSSYYATINEGLDFRYVDLVNEGIGHNYGVEMTLERSFDKNYYFLINGSIYSSKYKSLEGIERNTLYNGEYLVNVLVGKQFVNLGKNDNQTLSLNTKLFFGGGQKTIPLLRDNQGNLTVDPANNRYYDYKKAYNDKIDNVYQISLSASYKFNKPKATHEIFVNLDNVSNYKGRISEYYDESQPNNTGYVTQFGFFPNLMYRVYF